MTARILEYHPEDMTVTIEAGMLLSDLQGRLRESGQWLPIDPPFPERTTIGELLSENLSGPRRYAYGTIREHLLGLSARLADGRIIKSGGKVVKNVAGYDLHKLFVGSRGTLGTILQATFKVRPLPEMEIILEAPWDTLDKALESELTPVLLDLVPSSLVIGFAGAREEVDWQVALANSLGIRQPSNLDYQRAFWADQPAPFKLSVLPSRLMEAINSLEKGTPFLARAGNGILYYRGQKPPPEPPPDKLSDKLRSAFGADVRSTTGARMESSKLQKTPSTKHQAPSTREAPNPKTQIAYWCLGFLWCLVLGAWGFHGAWSFPSVFIRG